MHAERFLIAEEGHHYMRMFAVHGRSVSFNIREPPVRENPVLWLEKSIRDIYEYIISRVPTNTLIGVAFVLIGLREGRVACRSDLLKILVT